MDLVASTARAQVKSLSIFALRITAPKPTPSAEPTDTPTTTPTPTPTPTVSPTPTPTPTPVPSYQLTINDRLVYGGEEIVSLSTAIIRVLPGADDDNAYLAGTVVTLRALPRTPGKELIWNGVDSHSGGTATVRMTSDKSVEFLIGGVIPTPAPTPIPTKGTVLVATPTPLPPANTPTPQPPGQPTPTPIPQTGLSSPFTVNKTEDTNDGVCGSDCSLREAIGAASQGDTVNIPNGTFTLTLGSEIKIFVSLKLVGAGAQSTIIQAATAPNLANVRIF